MLLSVTELMCWPGSVVAKLTVSPPVVSWLPKASLIVAVAVLVELPFAVIWEGDRATASFAAGPGAWVRVVVPVSPALESVAVRVERPAVVD